MTTITRYQPHEIHERPLLLTRAPSRIYLLTDAQHLNSLSTIQERLLSKYNPVPLRPWHLDHRLLRSTPASPSDKTAPRFQHLLRLSYHPESAFVVVSPPSEAKAGTLDTVVTVPNEQYELFFTLLTDRFTALWNPRTHQVVNGQAYTVGEFTVRLGELRQIGNTQSPRGVVCFIEAISGIDEHGLAEPQSQEQRKKAVEVTRADMASLWDQIGYPSAKDYPSSDSTSDSAVNGGFDEVRTWCDLLRLRS
jgi:hypothetical protein